MMSKADHELPLPGNGNRVMADATTTSAIRSDPEVASHQRRTESLEDLEVCLSSGDERDEDIVEEDKMIRVDSLMEIRRWVKVQKKFFAPNTSDTSISEVRFQTSCRVVRCLDKLVVAVENVVDVLDERRRRGFPKYEQRRARRHELRKAEAATLLKTRNGVHDKEKSRNSKHDAPQSPTPTVLTPQRSHPDQSATHSKSRLNRRPVFKSNDQTTTRRSSSSGSEMSWKPNRHRCHTCRKTFASKHDFTRHRYTHLKEEEKTVARQGWSHVCYFCQKRFESKGTCNIHLLTHTKEKPYRCDQCENEFAENSSLTKHKRIHSGNPRPARSLPCEECDQTFTLKTSLIRHKKSLHRKLGAIDCPKCPRKFGTKDHMVHHLNGVHLKIRHPCPHCHRSYTYKGNVRKHMREFHPSKSRPLPVK